MPRNFLKYAEDNLAATNEGGLVDALSNTKRALDCQIELIIMEHSDGRKIKKENWNFPRKIKFLKKNQIIAPRILEKINRTRNSLEHEFKKPIVENVEDAFDVVTLFVGYTENLRRVPDSISLGFDPTTSKSYKVEFDKTNLAFIIFDDADQLFLLQEDDEGFERLLRLFHGSQPATYTLVHRSEIEDSTY